MKKLAILLLIAAQSFVVQAQEKLIALSFDDGPNTTTTVHMLDVLKKHGVKASFFVIGKNITEESAKSMIRAYQEGHDIENHSLTHSAMSQLTPDSIRSEVAATSALVKRYVGKAPRFFRPPYINVDQKMYDNIKLGFICGEGCEDWVDSITVDERVRRITASAKDGLIFLLHDYEGNEQTVAAVDRVIPILKKKGFRFVTVPELFKLKGVKPKRNVIYSDVMKPEYIIR